MIDPQRVTAAVTEFMKNPTWKSIFMNAPSGAMERLAISFYFSKYHDDFKPEDFQEYRDLRDEYEKSMTEEDLNYLIENSDKPTAIKHYQELLAKIQGGQQPTGTLRFEKEDNKASGEDSEEPNTSDGSNGENPPEQAQDGSQENPTGEEGGKVNVPPENKESVQKV